MADTNSQVSMMQHLLPRAVAGDDAAVDALLRHYSERLTILTRRMLGDFQRVRRWAETDDVLQNALVRLVGALRSVKPQTSRDFLALATLQIRRELLDLARHFYGPKGIAANQDTRAHQNSQTFGAADRPNSRSGPTSLARWPGLQERMGA